jgi:hypothetical protein
MSINQTDNDDDIPLSKVSIDVPTASLTIVDKFCKRSYIPRRKWMIDAMHEKIERDNLQKDK